MRPIKVAELEDPSVIISEASVIEDSEIELFKILGRIEPKVLDYR